MLSLHALLSSSKAKFQSLSWNDFAMASFHVTKLRLHSCSIHSGAPTCMVTEASDRAIGAVLQQHTWCPITFSRELSPAETRCSAFDKELLAIYIAIYHF